MNGKVLILRPLPGSERTATRARALGLEPIIAPLFRIEPIEGQAPLADRFDAVIVTSANGARHSHERLRAFHGLPCFAVGEASAAAAREAGFTDVRIGPSDGSALARLAVAGGVRRALHPCGRDRVAIRAAGLEIVPFPVYASEKLAALPSPAAAALDGDAVVLVHSSRAAAHFADLVGSRRTAVRLAAISASAAAAAGVGWGAVAVASEPRDPALLAVAAQLCHKPTS